jgi:hypothetical protein
VALFLSILKGIRFSGRIIFLFGGIFFMYGEEQNAHSPERSFDVEVAPQLSHFIELTSAAQPVFAGADIKSFSSGRSRSLSPINFSEPQKSHFNACLLAENSRKAPHCLHSNCSAEDILVSFTVRNYNL